MADARFPAGFIVSDGKINFSQDNIDKMTVEMMRQIIDYLDRRGIHGIELPDGIDEKLAAAYNEADGANREAEDAARINEQETPEAEEAPIRPLPENDGREEIPASGYTNQDARDLPMSSAATKPSWRLRPWTTANWSAILTTGFWRRRHE